MIDYGLFMMIYKPSKLVYSSVLLIVYIILYGIIFHEYHYIRLSVLTDPLKEKFGDIGAYSYSGGGGC